MKIEMNTIYHLPTQAHEDDFLKQADKQDLRWISGTKATENKRWSSFREAHCISVTRGRLDGFCNKSWYKGMSSHPIIEWEIGFSKADMQIGQAFKTRCGSVLSWDGRMPEYYKDDLSDFDSDTSMDIIEVYPFKLTPIWKREEPKYRVKTELTQEQAEKLGLEFCEVIE